VQEDRGTRSRAIGSGNIQVGGDLYISVYHTTTALPRSRLTAQHKRQIAALVGAIEQAELGKVSAKIIRGSMNRKLGVRTIDELDANDLPKALLYLNGWRACVGNEPLSDAAMVSQILRMGAICGLLGEVEEFAQRAFHTTQIMSLKGWSLKCVMAYAMYKWQRHWGQI